MFVLRFESSVRVDGRLDEPIWADAAESAPFVRYQNGEPAPSITTLRAAADGRGLCLAIRCREPRPDDVEARPADADGGGIGKGDSVEIFVDPGATRGQICQFFTNILGGRAQGLNNDYSWRAEWESAAARDDDGWAIEVRLPWSLFGAPPRPGAQWGLNVARNRHVKAGAGNGTTAWSPTFGGLRNPLRFGDAVFAGPPGALRPAPGGEDAVVRLAMRCADEVGGGGPWRREDFNDEDRATRAARLASLMPVVRRFPAPLYLSPCAPITDRLPRPWSVPDPDAVGRTVALSACPGEIEPAAVSIFTMSDLKGLRMSVTDLHGPGGALLPASAIDVHALVCWYQMGSVDIHREGITLVPELLLHDAGLIGPDFRGRVNRRRFEKFPEDATSLVAMDVPRYETRTFWLTLRVPAGTPPGLYRGAMVASDGGGEAARVPLTVRVRSFALDPPALDYGLYYTLRLDGTPETEARMAQEILDQVEHGITMPTTYENGRIEKVIEMQRAAGVRDDKPFICVTYGVGGQQTPEQVESMRKSVAAFDARVKKAGRPGCVVQGKDEASGEALKRERAAFQGVHDAGGKVFVACGHEFFDIVGDLLDMPVVAGPPRRDLAERVHKNGFRIYCYANPQSGVERPATYRRNYGLLLWAAGYDGAINYEYQSQTADPWDEFPEKHYRHHTFAYPAKGRPVDTAQWEGWREGVDDVRYLTTLLNRLAEAEKEGRLPEKTAAIRTWLRTIGGKDDLDAAREGIAAKIEELMERP